MKANLRLRERAPRILAVVFLVWGVARLAPFYVQSSPVVWRAYYEANGDGDRSIAYDEHLSDLFESTEATSGGRLRVPPGVTLLFPVSGDEAYSVRSSDSTRSPHVIFGQHADSRLRAPRVLAVAGNTLVATAWSGRDPWNVERQALAKVQEVCAGQREPVHIQRANGGLAVTVGHCSLLVAADAVAIAAGPTWAEAERHSGDWPLRRKTRFAVLLLIVAFGLIQLAGLGWWTAGMVALIVCVGGLRWPGPATAVWLVAGAAGIFGIAARGLWRLPPRWRGAAAALVVSIVGLASWLAVRRHSALPPGRVSCLLTGYSAARGVGLRHREAEGLFGHLEANGVCPNGAVLLAKEGETLAWVRDNVCSGPPADKVIFFGGANDDLLSGVKGATLVKTIVGIIQFAHRPLTPRALDELFADAAGWSVHKIADQEASIAAMATCVNSRGGQLLFVHDFLAVDLSAGRDPDRQKMLEARRRAVESAGGQFIDLLRGPGAQAGVSWFNDMVHPSAIGHHAIAAAVLDALRQPANTAGY